MGVDTKLYLDSKWEIRDIVTVLKMLHKDTNVEAIPCDKSLCGCFYIHVGNRQIFTITNTHTPIGTTTELILGYNDEAVEILKGVANILGGLFMENDYDGELEFIDGKLSPENGIPYFAKSLFLENNIDVDDYIGFVKAVNEWHNKYSTHTKPQSLKIIIDLLNSAKQ